MQKYLNAYQKVYPNLKKHDKSYPAPAYLKSVTKVGNIGYKGEMDSVTEGSELIKKKFLIMMREPCIFWHGVERIRFPEH